MESEAYRNKIDESIQKIIELTNKEIEVLQRYK
jgi:basic membrane lipoprotein Med (substrate-binding protein (PBP1-ABC) superfamily)